MDKIDLSIVIPAYNEASRIGATFESLERHFARTKMSHEIIVVDDGSSDTTCAVVASYAPRFKHFRLLENKLNKGKGFSVRRGMLEAQGAYRLFMDADNSVDISHIDEFLRHASVYPDVVIGSIMLKQATVHEHSGWHRRILGYFSKLLIRVCATPGIYDTQRGFKLFSAKAAQSIFLRQTIKRFGFDIEILLIARLMGFSVKELPVTWDNPAGSTVTIKSYFQTLYELAHIVYNRMIGTYNDRKA